MNCKKCQNQTLYRKTGFCSRHYREDLALRKRNPKSCIKCDIQLGVRKRSEYCNKCYHNKLVNTKQYYKLSKYKIKNSEYKKKNRAILSQKQKEREKIDINYKLARRLRHRLGLAVKGNFKQGSAVSDLGCSIAEFKIHIEAQFQEGMTWGNWSKKGWHIDHIKPLVSFDLANREEFLKAVHYSNLQPLWAKDNLSKGAKK